jgi:ubiquinone/menaquinone biosynthesis C-methylase UbiE
MDELNAIGERYARRSALPSDRYSRLNPEVLARVQERQRVMVRLLASVGITSLADRDVIEIGCGNGANLIEFIELGVDPQRLVGNDLLSQRLEQARDRLPASVSLLPGDASV